MSRPAAFMVKPHSQRSMLSKIDTSLILPLIGVALGWFLSEVGSRLRDRRDQKKVLGKAIFQLLEVREAVQIRRRAFNLAKVFAARGELADHALLLQVLDRDDIDKHLTGVAAIAR